MSLRSGIVGILGLGSLITVTQAQQPQFHAPGQDGGVREVLESIVIPPIPQAPFTTTLDTESVKYSGDGASMTFVNERHIARDGQGRVYGERWSLIPKGGKLESTMNWIQIADPKRRTLYNCAVEQHICDLLVYDPTGALSALSPVKCSSIPHSHSEGNVKCEDLGSRNIAGINTVGTRVTTIIEPGTMGNDQPLTSISEYWHSEELGINLLSIRSSPFFGKQTFSITELTAGEPDPQLFEVPSGFKINDQRKNPQISH